MVDGLTGWAVGQDNSGASRRPLVLKTTDGGKNWINQATFLPSNIAGMTAGLAHIHAVDAMNVTAVGIGSVILRTEDGEFWVDEGMLGQPNNWRDVSFPPNNPVNGMAVTVGGIARRQ
jgi:photosystem II stability/assembly factor-like uncharacterized protein